MSDFEILIRPADKGDLRHIIEIENRSFTDPWTLSMFNSHFSSKSGVTLVAVYEGELCAYINAYVLDGDSEKLDGECEIANIAVAPEFRRKHVACKLIEAVMSIAAKRNCSKSFLEVRESNLAAQSFYLKYGFEVCGRRKNYYNSPREDAVLMMREIY